MGLYKKFIDNKYDVYYQEKSKTPAGNIAGKAQRKRDIKNIQVEHQLLAIKTFLIKDQVALLPIDDQLTILGEELARIGIVQMNNEGKPQFIHRTLGEYLVADFVINQLTKKTEQHHTLVQELLLNNILLRTDCQVLKTFLDALLKIYEPSKETLKEYGRTLDEQWNEREEYRPVRGFTTLLHDTAAGDNASIIGFLLDSLKSGEHSKALTKMLFARNMLGRTALHMAAQKNSLQALKKIWEWAEVVKPTLTYSLPLSQDKDSREELEVIEKQLILTKEGQMNTNELKKILFLAKDNYGFIAWHYAAEEGSLQALETLWSWGKEVELNTDELLLARSGVGLTAFQLAAENNDVKTLHKLWSWAEEGQLNRNELKKKLILAKDQYGYTAWQRAAPQGSLLALETLWLCAKETGLNTDELLLAENHRGFTALHIAAGQNHLEMLRQLWVWAEEGQLIRND
jgi:ankyrin repeat protein